MIKLEVNHGKHKKKQSGQKLGSPQKPPAEEKEAEKKEVSPDKKKDKKKNKKEDKQSEQPPEQEKIDKKGKDKKKKQGKQKQKQKEKGKQDLNKSPGKPEKEQPKAKPADRELETLDRIKKEGQKTKISIDELISQYWDAADDIFTNHGHNPEKQMNIARRLEQLQKEKQSRHNRIQKLDERAKARSQKKQQKIHKKIQDREDRKKERRKRKAEQKIQVLRDLSQERLEKQAKYQEYLHNQYKNKIPRFKRLEQQFEEKEKLYEEGVKQKLQKHKRKYAPMSQEELQNFQDNYQEHRWQMIEENERKREEINEMIAEQNRELESKLWKGKCHKNVRNQRKQLEEKKNEAKTKLQKTKNYGTIVKSSFKPKIDEAKRNHSLTISRSGIDFEGEEDQQTLKFKKVARQKYIHGVNKGLVIEKLRKSLDHASKVQKGNQYLEKVRNLPKIRADGVQSARLEQTIPQQPDEEAGKQTKKLPTTTFKQKRVKNPYYRSSLSQKIPSKSGADDNKIKNPELMNYLLADIKARHQEMDLQEKVIKYGRYNGVLDLQNRHNKLNHKMVQSINDKLDILSRM